jgi:hypothetical protein
MINQHDNELELYNPDFCLLFDTKKEVRLKGKSSHEPLCLTKARRAEKGTEVNPRRRRS